jgi:5-methylthioribose kinase
VTISTIEIAGDGNMNFTYRLVFDDGLSKIVKQSSPYYATFSVIIAP